eukprot:426397-Hanusia_phi.AAC.1
MLPILLDRVLPRFEQQWRSGGLGMHGPGGVMRPRRGRRMQRAPRSESAGRQDGSGLGSVVGQHLLS